MTNNPPAPKRRQTPSTKAPTPLRAVGEGDNKTAAEKRAKEITQYSDPWAAERLARSLLNKDCYCAELGWMHCDKGIIWHPVSEAFVTEQARKFHKDTYGPALVDAVQNDKKSDITPLKRLLSRAGIVAVVSLCRGILLVEAEQFDTYTELLNTPSGIVNLQTLEILKHDPALLMTHVTGVKAVRNKPKHPDLVTMLSAIPPEIINYLQMRLGQAITGEPPNDERIPFLKGGGNNGKSTLINCLKKCCGNYCGIISDKVLLAAAGEHNTSLTTLRGVRLALIEELPEGRYLNIDALKKLTTRWITARKVHKDDITFLTSHSLIVTTNYDTSVSETDDGTWRRLQRIVFPYRYRDSEAQCEAEMDRLGDPKLKGRVEHDVEVQESLLWWLIEGAHAWYANGKVLSPEPASVAKANLDWRKEADMVLKYSEERLGFSVDRHIASTDLMADFNQWLNENGRSRWSSHTVKERFSNHDVFKRNHVIADVQTRHSKVGWSYSPHQTTPEGEGERVDRSDKTVGARAWRGVYFAGDELDDDDE